MSWDVFLGETLELQRDLSTRQVQAALVAGDLREDDLARPAGTKDPWLPIAQIEELAVRGRSSGAPEAIPPRPPEPTTALPGGIEPEAEPDDVSFPVLPDVTQIEMGDAPKAEVSPGPEPSAEFKLAPESSTAIPSPASWDWPEEIDEEPDGEVIEFEPIEEIGEEPEPSMLATPANPAEQWELDRDDLDSDLGVKREFADAESSSSKIAIPVIPDRSSQIALPVVASRDWSGAAVVEDGEAEEEETFTFARRSANKIEELDLAPMVDVAFQLVLFFMVTATTVLYKTLEVPKPSSDKPPDAVAQGKAKTVDELRDDYIVVEIDPSGTFKIDREPVVADMETLVERLRASRDKTARRTMLLSADYTTPHRFAVLAIDAANEIGMGIAVARPPAKQAQAPPPALFPLNPQQAQPKAKGG